MQIELKSDLLHEVNMCTLEKRGFQSTIHKLHINIFATILTITVVLCEACFS